MKTNLSMPEHDNDAEPPSPGDSPLDISNVTLITTDEPKTNGHKAPENGGSFLDKIKRLFQPKQDTSLREALEEAIEEERTYYDADDVSAHEKTLLSNVLKLRDLKVTDVMVPRADIVGISVDSTHEELLSLLADKQYNRIPVFKDNLDDMLGTIHIKDILAGLSKGETLVIGDLVREIPIVSPAMPILDLLLNMQQTHKHMAFVVDEFGGIDGLVTIGDVIESVVGEIDDEYDPDESPEMQRLSANSVMADARIHMDEFEKEFGEIFSDDEREENETLGGLLMYLAGRVPARGEVIRHESGALFEVLDADPRKINRLRIKNIPAKNPDDA